MSWSPRPGSAAPPARAPYPSQAQAAQPYGNQQNMYPNYPSAPSPAGNTQQQYWQTPQQPQFNQQYGQVYQQQEYGNNANQFYSQQAQYNQNYTNQGYTNTQPGYQQGYYQNQGLQQPNYQGKANTDSWEDNWDWGWDESAKQAQNAAAQNAAAQKPGQVAPPLPPQQQVFNNANVIEESFASTDTWSWAMEDKKETKEPASKQESAMLPVDRTALANNVSEPLQRSASNQSAQQSAEEVRTLSDRDAVKERLPNLALGKRFHIENLTPQWSIESQMSQESSDGPQTHSEGTYRSDNQSRNSSKSSPGLNTDHSNFNYSQAGFEEYPQSSEWSRHSNDEHTLIDNTESSSRQESHHELSNSMQEMSIANRENPASDIKQESMLATAPPSSMSPASFPPPVSSILPHPPSMSPAKMPTVSTLSSANLPAPSSGILPPPTNFPPSSSNTNPFKQSGPFSHKKVSSATPSLQSFPPSISGTNLTSPAIVSKASQHRVPVGYGANLETTPDNSERPDQPQISAFRPIPVTQQVPDNLEVAPQNDRNEYLQTAHLSSGDYEQNTDFSRSAPPPGFRRMVVGQQESEYSQNLNVSGDEPPPGLARMVPGQQTEADSSYNQPSETYLDRHIDGQPTDTSGRPYHQADGQQTPDNYTQPPPNRGTERRPIGLDRMVPGEPSNDEYVQYQGSSYAGANEQRVVMGVDHDYPMPTDAGPTDIREQNVDGSDYSEQTPRNPLRNVIGAQEINDVSPIFNPAPEEEQREVIMEGENLQDLSNISSSELTFSREQTLVGADIHIAEAGIDRKTDASDSVEHPSSSRRQSINRVNTSGEESERDRVFKSSPRRDRDKHKSSRDRDRDRDRERDKEDRYLRGDRKYDREPDRKSARDDRRPEKDRRDKDRDRDRRDRDESPDARRHRRSARSHKYETEDTDYYSDREKERRRYREGSYASKPPRPDDKERRYDDRDRNRRYNTIERERRYDDERDGASRSRRGDRHRDRYERKYRDIDPNKKYGNLRRERDEELRRGEAYSSPSRPASREPAPTDEELNESLAASASRRRPDTHRRPRHARPDPYYDGYGSSGYSDPYALQRQLQYQYYEHLRLSNPAAYMEVYKHVMAGHAPPPPPPDYRAPAKLAHHLYGEGYSSLGYEGRAEERGSVHSGRSSANGLKGNDTYYGARYRSGAGADAGSPRDAPSLRTDLSDRDLNTDASLNLQLEESTVRSERMTPFKFSTAHIKGSISSRHVVVVRPSYPVDGLPATVHILSLGAALAGDAHATELAGYPGPLVKGVTHKKSVIDYCGARVRDAARAGGRDAVGCVLLWELLALLLRQNGVVVGTDISELLMRNTQEYEYKPSVAKTAAHNDSRRGSSLSGRDEEPRSGSPDQPSATMSDLTPQDELSSPGTAQSGGDERAALDRLREYLIYGNRQEALEWAMTNNLWGHALQLSAYCERRTRAHVAARFLAALPRADPLHTLYSHLQAKQPPAATCVADERWGDWRPHVAMMLSNNSAKPDQDRRTLTQLGDSLSSRGLLYSAQFCYVSAGVQFERHPAAPLAPSAAAVARPRLALLLADPRAGTLAQLATNQAIFATEIYEYALSLNQDYVINELQVYKLVLACRLVDVGAYERALAYTEQAARAVTRSPRDYSPALVAQLAELAERLKYHDPALHEDAPLAAESGDGDDSGEPSPRHQQWLDDVKSVAHMLTAESASQQSTPLHHNYYTQPEPAAAAEPHAWGEPAQQQYQPPPTLPAPEEAPDYSHYYQQQQQQHQSEPQPQPEQQYGYGEDWQRAAEEPPAQPYADPYWQADAQYAYTEGAGTGAGALVGGDEQRPMITMPGASSSKPSLYADYDDDRPPSTDQTDRETDTPAAGGKDPKPKDEAKGERGKGGGWLGGILTKLSLRPPNQMILPDDKNPTIVWDADSQRWRNTDGDEDEPARAPPPPPRLQDLAPQMQSAPAAMQPPAGAAPVSNIFKMQKGRHIKKSYVDVFNPSGAPTRPLPPPAEVLGPAPVAPPGPAPQYFVPGAPAQTGVYDYDPAHQHTINDDRHSGI